jgi:hypothetical protein
MVHGTYGATLQVRVGEEGAQRKPVGLANLTFDRWCVWVGGCKSYVLAGIANFLALSQECLDGDGLNDWCV